ncbi:HlyD family secretion protein [Flavobacterium sangjuense]|uniref:Multidrug export protein EmrA n=1 Tax=Flavobacterium sangjuense TaxID=2518177 RepID=A0A4P7PW95_9FLAO|nr:HlyD family secretion protein [Flavobacterium sangjuense]QBZ98223.1 Multidrug export protein EmrA [Flavobacterium sangjuense]
MENKAATNKKFRLIFIALAVLGIVYGGYKYIHSLSHETTDDAQVAKKMNPIIPRVSGYITKVLVKDNDIVKKGDTLFVIDNNDYIVKVEEAKANLAAAENSFEVAKADIGTSQAGVSVSDANVQSANGSIETAKIRLRRASADFDRYNNLYKNHSITKQQFEQAEAAKQEAQSQLQILIDQQKASAFQRNVASARTNVSNKQVQVAAANIKKAQASLDAANLNLGYTVVTASIDGQVSTVDIQPGQLVQAGQSLFYIVNNNETWVIANFKETQLDKMRSGQKVKLKIDAFPGAEFEGEITSFSPATGSKFSLLPPDNASGNFVKTVQRLPVRINFTENNPKDKLQLLRSGMNADVDVILK